MNLGRTVFSQLIAFLPDREFRRCVTRYNGDQRLRAFSCWDQFLCMAFAQFTYREGLRDIEACLRSSPDKLYHMGIRGRVSRSTLADANESHDWHIFADFAQILIARARLLYAHDPFGVELQHSAYALDSTTIDLCLAMFPWARFRERKGAVKMHTLIDLHGNIPLFVCITDGKVHDVNILDQLLPEAGAFYVMDRGYLDFQRLHRLTLAAAFFVTRTKDNVLLRRRYSHPVDHTIVLTAPGSIKHYPAALRRVRIMLDRAGSCQDDGVIALHAGGVIDRMGIAAPQQDIVLGAGHEECRSECQTMEPLEVEIPTIHHIESARLR